MKLVPVILLLSGGLLAGPGKGDEPPAPPTHAPARLELHDQFGVAQTLAFPATRLTLLTIADRKGADQIPGWVVPIQRRFAGRIDIRGIADLSAVPGPLRSLVRKKFQKSQAYPVMLDWSGDAVNGFRYASGHANILVLDCQGRILRRSAGEATAQAITSLCEFIAATLGTGEGVED